MIKKRLENIRKLLDKYKFNGYIVPITDSYLNSYDRTTINNDHSVSRLKYITGFTGSNGLAIILQNIVLFFTDSRYIDQCALELDINLFKVFNLSLLEKFKWSKYLQNKSIIAYDPKLFTENTLKKISFPNLQKHLENLVDLIWKDKPKQLCSKVYNYPLEYTGEDYSSKIRRCYCFLEKHQARNLVITDAASVCWLLNIRAYDVIFSPLLLGNIIVTREKVYCFVNKNRLNRSVTRKEVEFVPEKEFHRFLQQLQGITVFDNTQCSIYIGDIIKNQKYKNVKNPCILWKAHKNDIEIQCMKQIHIQDSVAVCEFLSSISNRDNSNYTEHDLKQQMTKLRQKSQLYTCDSFSTICGYQDNAAVIHYSPDKNSSKKISGEGLLLIDSGGQYLGGTTDITRTISIGTPTSEHKKYYTKVLKGHIALAKAIFPRDKVTGAHLDILARQHLWNEGCDYAHSTGHGVGNFLSVHEGPQNISPYGFEEKISYGMVISNEPGYYAKGKFGIRIENIMYVKKAKSQNFLCFEMLTLVPYEKRLINYKMLTRDELSYLKDHYLNIKLNVLPLVSKDTNKWLQEQISI